MAIFKYVLIALLLGAAGGFIPMYLQLNDARVQAEATESQLTMELEASKQQLAISSIHSQLGVLLMQVRDSDFESARETSTGLYDRVDEALEVVEDPDDQRRLRTMAETRDQVTASLALNDATVTSVLERLFGLVSASLA